MTPRWFCHRSQHCDTCPVRSPRALRFAIAASPSCAKTNTNELSRVHMQTVRLRGMRARSHASSPRSPPTLSAEPSGLRLVHPRQLPVAQACASPSPSINPNLCPRSLRVYTRRSSRLRVYAYLFACPRPHHARTQYPGVYPSWVHLRVRKS